MVALNLNFQAKEAEQTPFHPDILEPIFARVPLIYLAAASRVSKSWNRAVLSSLRCFNKPKPWLIVHTQNIWSPCSGATHAYDPRSDVWFEIKPPPSIKHTSALRSNGSNLIYVLTPAKFSFSFDPLHLTWHHVDAPRVWRDDPIVALVGRRVVVACGVCDFEDDDLAVEVYDLDSGKWHRCDPMPEGLRDSAASWLLSVASDHRRLFLTEKRTGVTHTFDPETNKWSEPYDLCPDSSIFSSVIACYENQLILIGLIGEGDKVQRVKLWRVNRESDREFIGEMPQSFVEKLKIESFLVSPIGVCFAGNVMFIYNPSEVGEIIMCDFVNGGLRWSSLRNVVQGRSAVKRVVCTCSEIGLQEVENALREDNSRFTVKRT